MSDDTSKQIPCPNCGAEGHWEQNGTVLSSCDVRIWDDGEFDGFSESKEWFDTFEHENFECRACHLTWRNTNDILEALEAIREAGPFA